MWISHFHGLKEKIAAGFVIIIILVIYYNSVVFRGNSFMSTVSRSYRLGQYHYSGTYWHVARKRATADPAAANQINLPGAYLEHHYLKSFQLPLWNPYSGLGRPYNADMNSYTFFLPMYLFKIFPSLIMYDLFLLLRLFIAGFFFFLFFRLFKFPFWIAIAGSSFYMFNSYFHAFIDMDQINVLMFLSPMVYFLTKFLFSTDKRFLIGFVLCSAGSFYGGNPNEFILIHLFVTAFFIFLIVVRDSIDFKQKLVFFLSYFLSLGLSILLTSLKLIPFLEFWKNSYSSRAGGLTGISVVLPFKKFLSWVLFPDRILGGPNYIGYLIISLLFYSFFNLLRKKWRLTEKIVAFNFIFLFLIISKISGAFYINWIGTWPLLKNIIFVKYCSLLYFSISIVSSFSLMYIIEGIKTIRNRIKMLAFFLLCLILPHYLLWTISKSYLFRMADNGQNLIYIFIFFVLIGSSLIIVNKTYKNKNIINYGILILAVLAIFELRLNNHQYYRNRFKINDKAPYTEYLLKQQMPYRAIGIEGALSPNQNLVYPIPTINRMFAIRIIRPTVLLFRLISKKFDSGMPQLYYKQEILNNPYLDLLNTKYYISESIIDSLVIDPKFAASHKVKSLINNPAMQFKPCGNLYYYTHWGWWQLANSSIDIPLRLPYGDVHLKSTALAFNFDWRRRENLDNKLDLIISVRQGDMKEVVYKRTFIAHRKKDQDFFNLEVDLSRYAGQNIILNLTLRNLGAVNRNDRIFFFGDLRITYTKIRKSIYSNINNQHISSRARFENVPYEDIFSHHAIIYKNNKALPRGFVLYRIKRIRDLNEAVKIMKKDPFVYKKIALIEAEVPPHITLGKIGQSKVSFVEYRANYVKIKVETTEDGVFVLSDAYYPGWKAFIDHERVRIFPAFGALRAVFISEGKHELIFYYRPWSFYLGLILTFISSVFIGYLYFSKLNIFR